MTSERHPNLGTAICGDCLEEMRKLPDASVKLVVTSPPYNLRHGVSTWTPEAMKNSKWNTAALIDGYDNYTDNLPHAEYVAWQRECLTEMLRLLRDDGAIFYNHKWRMQGKLLQDRSDILAGFPVRQILIWDRMSALNITPSCFMPSYEVIYMVAKPGFTIHRGHRGIGAVWRILPERSDNKHPAPFPLAIPERIIAACCRPGDVVLDPFMGSGTTPLAAEQAGLPWIGIDNSPVYIDLALQRIDDETKQGALL